jgi:anti-sigma regulatory factor (Ser/Thr protein kinase)
MGRHGQQLLGGTYRTEPDSDVLPSPADEREEAVIETVELRAVLAADPEQVGRARRLVAARLPGWGLDDDAGDVAVLLVSELVTNAILHGVPPLELVAFPLGDGLRVEVHDAGDASPVMRPSAPDVGSGRGLHLVDALATRWGSERTGLGKSVWFELAASA